MKKPKSQPSPSVRASRLEALRARKAREAKRREAMLDLIASGGDYAEIANGLGVSLRTVRREVDRALDERPLEAPHRYLRLQVNRLNRAMMVASGALEGGDLKAMKPLLQVLDRLDRYHGLAAVAAQEGAAPALAAPAPAPLSLTHDASDILDEMDNILHLNP